MSAYHLNGILGSFFLDKWNCSFFPLRKRNRLNLLIGSFGCQWAGVWVHVIKKLGGLTSCRARRFIGRRGIYIFFGGEKAATISSVWLLQHPHFVRETSNQHPHFFPAMYMQLRLKQAGIPNHASKRTHKYRPQNFIRFHLQGCSCVLKHPPTLPTSKDTLCNDKRFGNQLPSFRS